MIVLVCIVYMFPKMYISSWKRVKSKTKKKNQNESAVAEEQFVIMEWKSLFTKEKWTANHAVPKQSYFITKLKHEHIFFVSARACMRPFDCLWASEHNVLWSTIIKSPHCTIVFTVSLEIRHFPILMVICMGGKRPIATTNTWNETLRNETKTKTKTEIVNNDLFLNVLITFCLFSFWSLFFVLFWMIFGLFLLLLRFFGEEKLKRIKMVTIRRIESLPTPRIELNYLLFLLAGVLNSIWNKAKVTAAAAVAAAAASAVVVAKH